MYQICFLIFAVHKLWTTLENSTCILQLSYRDFVSCITHKYVNICSYSYYLQQYKLMFMKESMGVTPCWKDHALVYSNDSASLRFDDLVTKWYGICILNIYMCIYIIYIYMYIYNIYIYIYIYVYIQEYHTITCIPIL